MVPVTSPATAAANAPVFCPEPSSQCLASYNWAGYAICAEPQSDCSAFEAVQGSVTYVTGSWTVPRITTAYGYGSQSCSDQENTWYDAATWIGIDGLFSNTVEQTGTSSDCFYGQTSYYAWYEFYPAASSPVDITVNPGDSITASVTCTVASGGANCITTISDLSNGQSFTSPLTFVPGALLDSAEWIEESAYYNGFLALTPVTPATFTNAAATIGGSTKQLSNWGSQVYWLVMVTYDFPYVPTYQQSSMVKAEPSLVRGGSFTSTWYSSGP